MGSAPSVNTYDPSAVSAQQFGYDVQAGETAQAASNVNQQTPYGSLTYQQTGTGPNGVPTYTATTQLSPQEQALFNATVGTQGTAATQAGAGLAAANYGATNPTTAIGDMSSGLTGEQMGSFLQGEEPFFNYQTEGLQSQLANQGLTAGSPAYDQAMNLLEQQQGNVVNTAESQFEPAAFSQAQTLYQEPLTIAGQEFGIGQPGNVSQNLINTPTASIATPNVVGAYGTAEQAQIAQAQLAEQQYSGMLNGIGSLGSALLSF